MKKWNNRIKNRKNKTQIRKNNKIKIDKIEIKNKMSNKAFGKMKKAGKTHNRGSPHKQHDTELGARNFFQ